MMAWFRRLLSRRLPVAARDAAARPLCIGCRWFAPGLSAERPAIGARCQHPCMHVPASAPDPVSGEVPPREAMYCLVARQSGACGPAGSLWEPRS